MAKCGDDMVNSVKFTRGFHTKDPPCIEIKTSTRTLSLKREDFQVKFLRAKFKINVEDGLKLPISAMFLRNVSKK